MRKLVKLSVSFATIGVLAVLAACGGGGGNSGSTGAVPQANSGVGHSVKTMSGPSRGPFGGGATFPAFAYNGGVQPPSNPASGSIFFSTVYGGNHHIKYCLTGSGYGRTVYENNNGGTDTAEGTCAAIGSSPTGFGGATPRPDFAGSDVALATSDYNTYVTSYPTPGGSPPPGFGFPVEIPSIGGGISIAFVSNASGITTTNLQLSANTICDIASGNVTDWNNSEVTTDNGGTSVTGGVSVPIFFNYRSDGSGTSFLFQTYLNDVCPSGSYWDPANHKASTAWQGPTTGNFSGHSGNPGVARAIQTEVDNSSDFGAVGYVETGWLVPSGSPTLTSALVQNSSGNFEAPTNTNIAAGLANASITQGGTSDGNNLSNLNDPLTACVLYVDPSTFLNGSASNAYPIAGLSYLLFYSMGNNATTGSNQLGNLQALGNYLANGGIGTNSSSSGGYVALPSSIRSAVGTALSSTGTNCLDQDN